MGITPAEALIARGVMSENDYFNCLAHELGLEFCNATPANGDPFFECPPPDVLRRMAGAVQPKPSPHSDVCDEGLDEDLIYLAPDGRQIEILRRMITDNPLIAERLRISTLSENRRALEKRCERSLTNKAVNGLRETAPELSAFHVISVRQALFLFCALQALGIIVFFSGGEILLLAHLFATAFYISCVAMRFYAAMALRPEERTASSAAAPAHGRMSEETLPHYSVLVALYDEAYQVDRLVDSLLKLDWPVERLEIALVCEADDGNTIQSVNRKLAVVKASHIKLISVPPGKPRTKPKALNYALPLCRGDFIVIYDAEDTPDPFQLREAYARFKQGAEDLACLQAPLTIGNPEDGWLARMFAVEYSALFDGLLPMLANHQAPLPLGGTSNHFRREALDFVGGWDAFNVTEDADLGIRLARAGFQIGTLTCPTFEDAPIDPDVWLKQRTRWFKGWLQTWLVHMRHPIRLSRELGAKGTLVFHLVVTGMVLSAFVHPILLYFVVLRLGDVFNNGLVASIADTLFVLDLATILFGYVAFGTLAWRTLPIRGQKGLRRALWGIPVLWILLSAAAWRALWHLIRRPHHWEKTPHHPSPGRPGNGQSAFRHAA